jgi:hypothetical protein
MKYFVVCLAYGVLLVVSSLSFSSCSNEKGLANWTNKIELTIDHTKIDYPLVDFPVLIHLSESSGIDSTDVSYIFNSMESNNNQKKIAVATSDGLSECNVEIEKWDNNLKQALLWVKLPHVSNLEDTRLYLYYDKNHVDNNTKVGDTRSFPAEAVWSNGFVGVWHLEESGMGILGEYKDSTSKHHDGQGGDGDPLRTPKKVDEGQLFIENSQQYITIPDSDDFSITNTNYLTVSAWISPALLNFTNHDDYDVFLGKSGSGQHEWFLQMYNQNAGERSQWISAYVHNPSGGLGAGDYSTGNVGINEWVYITARFVFTSPSSGVIYIYRGPAIRNSTDDESNHLEAYHIHYINGMEPLRIGTGFIEDGSFWAGRIKEVRVNNAARSDEEALSWIKASYYTESDNLLHFSQSH